MAQIRLYSNVLRGFIEYTGNTVIGINTSSSYAGIQATPIQPGGTFIPLTSWRVNSSSANLTGLPGSTVVKAYLAWVATVLPDVNGTFTNQNIAVTFTTPLGANSISGNPAWFQQNTVVGTQYFNIQVADVTDLVSAAGTGMYTVGGIPTGSNYGGWTLTVVWGNTSLPPRFISIDSYDDLELIGNTLQLVLAGFITPPTGAVNGRIAMVVGSAENNTVSGPTKFGPTVPGLVSLSGPNNNVTNFFQSQINNANSESALVGQLDTTGTFGLNNPSTSGTAPNNVRWHWDQTNVSISSTLTNNQTQGIVQFGPVNDAYVVHLLSVQIDAQSPTFTPLTKTVDKGYGAAGDTLTYTVAITNNGNFSSGNVIFVDTIPTNTTFISNSFKINGVTQVGVNPQSGANIGSFSVGASATISFQVQINGALTTPTTVINSSYVGYNYTPATGLTFFGNAISNSVTTTVTYARINTTKTVSKVYATVGDLINYTVVLNKSGDATANNVVFMDTIPNGEVFVANSLSVNGVTQVGVNPNPPGYNLGSITATPTTISFQAIVNTIPIPNPMQNYATTSYFFTQNPSIPNAVFLSTITNTVTTTVNYANLNNTYKFADKAYADCGDVITYTIIVPNVGNVTAYNVTFFDTIPNSTVFIPNSLTINGIAQAGANPQAGTTIGNINPSTTVTLTFKVQVQC